MGPRISKEGSEKRRDVEARVNQKRSKGGARKNRAKHRDPREMRGRCQVEARGEDGGNKGETRENEAREKQERSKGKGRREAEQKHGRGTWNLTPFWEALGCLFGAFWRHFGPPPGAPTWPKIAPKSI